MASTNFPARRTTRAAQPVDVAAL